MYKLTVYDAVFTVLDIETTGLNTDVDEIIEIGAIKYQGNLEIDRFHSLIKPPQAFIPKHISKITGITTAMIIDKPTIEEILPVFLDFIKDTILVGHNINKDLAFLNRDTAKFLNKKIKNPFICTDRLARKIMPDVDSKSLVNLAKIFNIPVKKHHRAIYDTEVNLEIFKKMIEFLESYSVIKVLDIIKLSEGKKVNRKEKRRRYV